MSNAPEKPDSSKVVHNLIPSEWDRGPYNVANELKYLLCPIADAGTSIDTGTSDGLADLWVTVDGEEYHLTVKRAGCDATGGAVFDASRIRAALERAADALFDAGLKDDWALARAALGERT